MTDLLLKNKKLLNKEITQFIYNNKTFSNKLSDLISLFKKRYNNRNITLNDKIALYKFSVDNGNNANF